MNTSIINFKTLKTKIKFGNYIFWSVE